MPKPHKLQVNLERISERLPQADLYGVGVGSGHPDLISLQALAVLHEVDHLLIPRSSQHTPSLAWRIIKDHITTSKAKRTELFFPMTKDPNIIRPAWKKNLEQISKIMSSGQQCAFITQGDPFFYSTFIYLFDQIQTLHPNKKITVIPAVSSITAAAAVAQIPLVDGREKMAILPASYHLDHLLQILRIFDTVLLLKVSSVLPKIIEILKQEKLLKQATFVRRATMLEGEVILTHLPDAVSNHCDYFSLIIVKKKVNDKVLFGKQAL